MDQIGQMKLMVFDSMASDIVGCPVSNLPDGSWDEIDDPEALPNSIKNLVSRVLSNDTTEKEEEIPADSNDQKLFTMGDRRQRAKGKKKTVGSSRSDYPEDIPEGCKKTNELEKCEKKIVKGRMIQEEDCTCIIETESEGSSCSNSKSKNKKKSSKVEKAKADPCFGKMKDKKVFKIRNLHVVKDVDERKLIELLQKGPIAVSIAVANDFKLFKGDEVHKGYPKSGRKALRDHMVLLTGYGTTSDGVHYWEFQNSYGLEWGKDGFGRLIRQCSQEKEEPSLINAYIYPEILA
ncbi:PREDICTED: uncharacterized protein LOC104703972 [Camelina sativa]|uniref:Uncharacterized protein LOC104703972 n=1 Tax=Camelina sativa TaxID=90675 RepID=A0ABM0SZG6_CAMSA|nr:PREDICTED: uncharacterized protein LOC104703972 [Camelina sativa]